VIGNCITDGKYNMTANLYAKTNEPNSKTGQVKARYVIKSTGFDCIARGLTNLRGKDSGTMRDWGNKLDDYHYLRIKTMQLMEAGDLVTHILDSDGNLYLNDSVQFVVLGVTPTYEPFGSFMEYDIILNKAEVNVSLPAPNDMVDTAVVGSSESSNLVIS